MVSELSEVRACLRTVQSWVHAVIMKYLNILSISYVGKGMAYTNTHTYYVLYVW